jgi:hypothetical protein
MATPRDRWVQQIFQTHPSKEVDEREKNKIPKSKKAFPFTPDKCIRPLNWSKQGAGAGAGISFEVFTLLFACPYPFSDIFEYSK